jgi:electron transfer flavoprotein alpha/beta subunit
VTERLAPTQPMTLKPRAGGPVVVWLGSAAPVRSVRWLDGALATAAKFGAATALAAGESNWLDLAADRATRANVASAGVTTDLELDYLGWAQIAAAAARELGASTILVDEASRPERAAEVGAIAELLDCVQLTRVVALAPDGAVVHASRVSGRELMTVRVRGPAVIGVRIAGAPVEEYPTPMPSASMRRLDLAALGLDASVLGHRALPKRTSAQPRKSVERLADYLAVHRAATPPVRGGR